MTSFGRPSPAEREAQKILEAEGYRVMPMRPCFATRYKPVNLMATKPQEELIYLKIKQPICLPADAASVMDACRDDAEFIRRFFPLEPGYIRLRKQIWILPRNGELCKIAIHPDGKMEIICG